MFNTGGKAIESHGEGLFYLENSLRNRIQDENVDKRVLDLFKSLRTEANANSALAERVHANIVMSAFGMKNGLMNNFTRDIAQFEQFYPKVDNHRGGATMWVAGFPIAKY